MAPNHCNQYRLLTQPREGQGKKNPYNSQKQQDFKMWNSFLFWTKAYIEILRFFSFRSILEVFFFLEALLINRDIKSEHL